jgi:hypothetical protein
LVIIASICVAWFELWLMPFRVLDREQQRDVWLRFHFFLCDFYFLSAVETGTGTFVADSGRRLTAQELIRQIVTNEEELFQTAMEEDSSGIIQLLQYRMISDFTILQTTTKIGAKM